MHGSESDIPADTAMARSRETGGRDPDRPDSDTPGGHPGDPDGIGTTGVDRSEEFVGRVAGDDAGYAGETGAEARAAAGETNR